MTNSRHLLSSSLDPRLLAFGARSWNGHEAVYAFQQVVALLPVFESNLISMYGNYGVGDARRSWGAVADLAAAMTGLMPTMGSLRDLGLDQALSVGYIVPYTGGFALCGTPAAHKLNASESDLASDALVLFARADAYDRVSRPLMQALRDELKAYDAPDGDNTEEGTFSFRKLALSLDDQPEDFPEWDGRPLLLHEQKALLDFLVKKSALEVVVDNLVEDVIGELICNAAGLTDTSAVTNEVIWNVDVVPIQILRKPVNLMFAQIGGCVLRILRALGDAPSLDRLYAVEKAVLIEFGLDIAKALEPTKERLIEEAIIDFQQPIVDLREANSSARFIRSSQMKSLERFDFPGFEEGA